MSHHGLQVLYSLMNARDDWYCERAFTPWSDMEREMRSRDFLDEVAAREAVAAGAREANPG